MGCGELDRQRTQRDSVDGGRCDSALCLGQTEATFRDQSGMERAGRTGMVGESLPFGTFI